MNIHSQVLKFAWWRVEMQRRDTKFPIGFVCAFKICLQRPITHRCGSSGFDCAQCEGFGKEDGLVTLKLRPCIDIRTWPPLNAPLSVPLNAPLSVPVSVGILENKAFWPNLRKGTRHGFLALCGASVLGHSVGTNMKFANESWMGPSRPSGKTAVQVGPTNALFVWGVDVLRHVLLWMEKL